MTQTRRTTNRSELLFGRLKDIDGEVWDFGEVAAICQLLDECRTYSSLEWLGRRIQRTRLAECDREVLRKVFRGCRDALQMAGADMRPAASEKQIKFLRWKKVEEWRLRGVTMDEARTLMGRVKRSEKTDVETVSET